MPTATKDGNGSSPTGLPLLRAKLAREIVSRAESGAMLRTRSGSGSAGSPTSPDGSTSNASRFPTQPDLAKLCQPPSDEAALAKRISLGCALNHPIDSQGNTPLHLAVLHGDRALVALLLRKGADPNVQNCAGLSPLDVADALERTKDAVPPPAPVPATPTTPGSATTPVTPKPPKGVLSPDAGPSIACLLERFGSVDRDALAPTRDFDARPALALSTNDLLSAATSPHVLATLGQTWHLLPLINPLTLDAVDRSSPGDPGTTPLMRAAAGGHADLVAKLIARGANLRVTDRKKFTALTWAAAGGWRGTVAELLSDPHPRPSDAGVGAAVSPLLVASFFGHTEVVDLLLAHGWKPGVADVMMSAWMRHGGVLDRLLSAGGPLLQPFLAWLARGRSARHEWEARHCFLHDQGTDPATASAMVAAAGSGGGGGAAATGLSSASLADVEIERLLTVASPESALTAGKAYVKSVPTKTAHQAGHDLRSELQQQEVSRMLRIRGGEVAPFRRGPILVGRRRRGRPGSPASASPREDGEGDDDEESAWVISDALVEQVKAEYRDQYRAVAQALPSRGTEIDVDVAILAVQVLELFKCASDGDNSKYTAHSVKIASQVQTCEAKFHRTKTSRWPHRIQKLLADRCQYAEDELVPDLIKSTRLASGIWPPPTAVANMLSAADRVLRFMRGVAEIANAAGVWPCGRIAPAALVRHPSFSRGPLTFASYRRDNQLHLIDALTQKAGSRSSTVSRAPKTAATAARGNPEDERFFATDIDPVVSQFVAAVRGLRDAARADAKQVYRSQSQAIHAHIDQLVDEVQGYSLFRGGIPPTLMTDDGKATLPATMARRVAAVRQSADTLVQRAVVASGVWPPPTAPKDLVDALLPCAVAVKEVVEFARAAAAIVRKSGDAEMARAEERQRIWMHGEQVRTMFQLWESAGNSEEKHAPSAAAVRSSVVLRDSGWLEDPSDGLVFDETHGYVRGGRLIRLVERLTHHEKFDESFIKAFLMTHHSFTTSLDLLAVLFKRYDQAPPFGINDEEVFRAYVELKVMPVKAKVLNVIMIWVNSFFADFLNDEKALMVKLKEFINLKAAHDFPSKAEQIMNQLANQLAALDSAELPLDTKVAPKPVLSKALSKLEELAVGAVMDVDPLEVARQWTLIEAKFFRAISNKEWINQIWGRAHEASRIKAPTIDNMIMTTNRVTKLIANMVVSAEKERERHAVIKYWIHVAQACATLQNFNAVTAVVAGLTMGPVRRLDKTWKSFNQKHPKSSEAFTKLSDVVSTSGQYLNYRRMIKAVHPPCIPFLGVFITDLTFIEDGNPDYLPENHLINFEKRRKVAAIIEEITRWQRSCRYHLYPVPALQKFLTDLRTNELTERALYDLSLKAEPIQDDDDDDE
ncbi:hypothetical protein H9P43_001664 [Blastocladiella emersonii ATCC 22665]|nr:hypothetical protein H9P43_001664 [Blastocladiella emersonii ATCC 22665]